MIFFFRLDYPLPAAAATDELALRSILQKVAFDPINIGENWGNIIDKKIASDGGEHLITLFLAKTAWAAVTRVWREATGGQDPDLLDGNLWNVATMGWVRKKRPA